MHLSPRFLLAAGLLATAFSTAYAKIERTVEKTFTVAPGGTLHVETQGGNIRVEPGSGDSVQVVAKEKIRASTEAEADELLKKLELTIEQAGTDVNVRSKYENKPFGWSLGSWPPVQVDFVVKVPTRFNTDLHTSGGDVSVGDLTGTIAARTSGGDIKLGKIDGEIKASTSGGNVSLVESTGNAKLHTSGGNIRTGRVGGDADLETSGGDIDIKAGAGSINASTSGGNVTASFVGALKDNCSLHTSGGRVKVTVEPSLAFNLDASTSGGDVDASGLTITIEKGGSGRSRLAGKVNGGGPVLKLRSSGGDIRVASTR